MVGKSKPDQLDRLIDEVARGSRELRSVKDERLREAIRLALRIQRQTTDAPDAYTRLRMRARVLGNLKPRGPSLADHAWTALELLARPAPLIARGIALAAVLAALGLGATVASADTLPDDLLYPVKVASEGVRLALAGTPEDRAEVELSIAEHRLGEAERLAANGRTSDALVAAAVYSQHIAWAAAELAPRSDASDLPQQLETRFAAQRERAQTLAVSLSENAKSAPAARILAMIGAPTLAPGATGAQRVADTAAGVAEQLVKAAEQADDANGSETVSFAEPISVPSTTTPSVRATVTPTAAEATKPPKSAPATDTGTENAPTVASPTPAATVRVTDAATGRREGDGQRDSETTQKTQTAPGGRGSSGDADQTKPRQASPADGRTSEVLKAVRRAAEDAKAAADKARKHK